MQILRWVGVAGALLSGLVLAQTTGEEAAAQAETVSRQSLPEPQISSATAEKKQPPAVEGMIETDKEKGSGGDSELAESGQAESGPESGTESTQLENTESAETKTAINSASAVVGKLNAAVLKAMRHADDLGFKGRFELLAPVIREVYDFKAISRHVLGEYWKKLSEEQKQQFIQKMTEYGISEYAGQFDDYDGEKFSILSEEPFRKRYRVVKARLVVPKGEDVEFVYILRQTREGWKIIDVRYDGVSDLALKRGQFAEILESGGFEKLIAKLDEKIANYAGGNQEG